MTQQEIKQQILGLDKEEQKDLLYFIHSLLDADRYNNTTSRSRISKLIKQHATTEAEGQRIIL